MRADERWDHLQTLQACWGGKTQSAWNSELGHLSGRTRKALTQGPLAREESSKKELSRKEGVEGQNKDQRVLVSMGEARTLSVLFWIVLRTYTKMGLDTQEISILKVPLADSLISKSMQLTVNSWEVKGGKDLIWLKPSGRPSRAGETGSASWKMGRIQKDKEVQLDVPDGGNTGHWGDSK